MKKIMGMLISFVVIMQMSIVASFAASANVEFDVRTVEVKVSGTDSANKPVDIIIFAKDAAMTPANCVYVNQTLCSDSGAFEFNFKMPENKASGEYTIYISGEDKIVFTCNFNYISTEPLIESLKNATTEAAYKEIVTANAALFESGIKDADDALIRAMMGKSFGSVAELEEYFDMILCRGEFKQANAAGKADIYLENAAKLGLTMPEEFAQISDKKFVFEAISNTEYELDDTEKMNDALWLGVFFARLYEGGFKEIDSLVVDTKAKADILGLSPVISSYSDTQIQKKIKKMLGEKVTNVTDFATLFKNTVIDEGSSGGSTGGSSGGNVSGKGTNGISVSAAPGVITQKEGFRDIEHVAWAKPAIESLSKRGIISGISETESAPDALVTREQFTKMFVLALALFEEDAKTDFVDVAVSDWFYPYVSSAQSCGIVKGDENGCFGAGAFITREDMAVMLYRAAQAARISFAAGDEMSFYDAGEISGYAKDAVMTMANANIINGSDGAFMPKAPATRAQAAKMIYEIVLLKEGADA